MKKVFALVAAAAACQAAFAAGVDTLSKELKDSGAKKKSLQE